MPSLDFEKEKLVFSQYYDSNHRLLEDAKDSFITLITALVTYSCGISISKLEGRVKDKDECVRKFNRKYRASLEEKSEQYSIADHITDLIGIRIVCLYEDDIEKIRDSLSKHFEVIDITDKISQIESTEDSFGYKGLHLDLKINEDRKNLPEYSIYVNFRFEVQVRTIIQDSWSVLDHKIKYKKSIPNRLKRRINTLAALFELADREFREIRDSTEEEIKKESVSEAQLTKESAAATDTQEPDSHRHFALNAFGFLRISQHFFKEYEFEPHKVDSFTQEIVSMKPGISRGKFNFYMRENISKVKRYQASFEQSKPNERLNPYTIIRHCLYLGDKEIFSSMLTNIAKSSFEEWLARNG